MTRRNNFGTALLRRLAQFACALGFLASLAARPALAQEIAIGEGFALHWGQFFIADQRKFWEAQGLTPKVTTFASGRLVLDAVVGGAVVIGTAAETPVAFANLNGLPVRVIGTLNRHEPFDLVADKSIATVKDIKGRKIGYSQGTNSHYYLHKVLGEAGLTLSDITAISLSPADFVASLTNGSIDAFIWTEPHQSQALAQGKGRFHIIRSPGLYHTFSNIIALQSTIDKNPELLTKALKALIAADEVLKAEPETAATVVAERIKLAPEIVRSFWPRTRFDVSLDKPALVKELEAQAKWAIANSLVRPDAKLPDFEKVVVEGPLLAARAK